MSQVIHALLIEDNRIEARQTQYWLATNNDVAIEVEWVAQLAEGLERLAQGGIDVVLLDLNLPDSRGLDTFATLHQRVPDVPVVVLTGEHDESIGITAVEQGAEDYLVKQQVDGGKLPKIVAYTVARHRAQVNAITKALQGKSARILSFLGAKGGVGTTTTALNVAVALAESGKSVILAELMPTFGDLAFSIQSEPTASLADLRDLPAERIDEHVLSAHLCQGPAAIRILFGSHSKKPGWEPDAEHAEAVIKGLARLADFVILDLAGWPSSAMATAARLSQFVAVVTAREPLAVKCGQSAVAQLKSGGISGGLLGAIVIGQSDLATSMEFSDIQEQMGCGILRLIPPAATACSKAAAQGVPLVLSQPMNEATEAYLEIANLLMDDRAAKFETAA
jgi:MinD-like ATPase involved in chromosome partitioning or flagellar assembly/ActR/RegA family two-component response regulator